jgi:hypothetical protein
MLHSRKVCLFSQDTPSAVFPSTAKKHIFSESAHVLNMEEPEAFTRVVLSFLDGLK